MASYYNKFGHYNVKRLINIIKADFPALPLDYVIVKKCYTR